MERVSIKRPPEFVSHDAVWLERLFLPVWFAYAGLASPINRWMRFGLWRRLDDGHFLFFCFLCLGMSLLVPKSFVIAWRLLHRVFRPDDIAPLQDVSLPYVPAYIGMAVLLFLLTFGARRQIRLGVLFGFSVVLIAQVFTIEVKSLLFFALLSSSWFLLIKSRLPRLVVFAICLASAVWLRTVMQGSQSAWFEGLGPLVSPLPIMIALLWYSTYAQYPPRHILTLPRFLFYMYMRLFGGPAATYNDYFRDADKDLLRVRFQGIKALYSALFAIHVVWVLRNHVLLPLEGLSGLELLFHAYLEYVVVYLKFLIGVNMFIGIVRLFGIPVRDNFRQVFLARTPNDHWRRWNILLREWLLTFAFYPVMRAGRGLFLAVMAALMTSGLLHVLASITHRDGTWEGGSIILGYWVANGLAIYAVLKVQRGYPQLVARTRMAESRVWAVLGVILTSVFYGVLIGTVSTCRTWPEVGDFFRRLFLA